MQTVVAGRSRAVAAAVVIVALLAGCGGGGGSSSPLPRSTVGPNPGTTSNPSPSPTSTATTAAQAAAFTCPTSETGSVARAGAPVTQTTDAVRHARSGARPSSTGSNTAYLAVTYAKNAVTVTGTSLTPQEAALGLQFHAQVAAPSGASITRVLAVPAASSTTIAAKLRSTAGVLSVGTGGGRRYKQTVTNPVWTNDPYFQGFTSAQNTTAGNGSAAATFEQLPYVENANVPGQWDMHLIGLEHAFGYSVANNAPVTNANAMGSANVKIAIIDTGEDQTHPELAGKITRARCFITNTNGVQSTGTFSTDEDGHGTDVTGIAAAATNNGLGFTGAGGNTSIFAYRVFPTPDDNCTNDSTTDPQCAADTADIASAIDDAVSAGANIISMSLGGDGCSAGVDSDSVEGAAVANAIAHNVIVVAAAGNAGGSGVAAPGCDSGVIAVGASALDDGQANGTASYGGTSSAPVEYVPSYSQYGSPGSSFRSASAWGILAPGGDPKGDNDNDDLHWIENVWTTTPYKANSADTSFTGACTADYPNSTSPTPADCRTLIAGTSMSTPHVAGAAALILAVSGTTYATPTAMKTLLCATADNVSNGNEGCGRLNVYRAMATALNDPTLP